MSEGLQTLLQYAEAKASAPDPAGLVITLHVFDAEVCAELEEHQEGRPRHDFAVNALKIGAMALRHARGRVDGERIREEGDRLLENLAAALTEHQRALVQELTQNLKEYFDPQSGRFNERIERLIKKDGELEQLLCSQVGADSSQLVRTLSTHIGEGSPLMQVLDPRASDGLPSTLAATVTAAVVEQRERILREFSLDNKGGALSRLVLELTDQHAQASGSLAEHIQKAVSEFSLDREDSALSRLVRRVEHAQKQISSELSLDEENSALARMRRELVLVVEAVKKNNDEFHSQVLEKLAESSARKEESRRSPRHGHVFEDNVYDYIHFACQAAGDVAIRTGASPGLIKNCKKGDAVVELGCEHAAAGGRIVVEAKEQASFGLKAALVEIEEARKNREASVGLCVLSSRTAPQGLAPLARHGNDVVVVWDPDDAAAEIMLAGALSVAKALCTRVEAHGESEAADFEAIERAIRNIEKKSEDLEQICSWVGTICSNGDKIAKKVSTMRTDIAKQIETLDAKVGNLRGLVAIS